MPTWAVAKCKANACQAPVIWTVTDKGNRMLVDAEPSADGAIALYDIGTAEPLATILPMDDRLDRTDLHRPHWATCVNPSRFRRPR